MNGIRHSLSKVRLLLVGGDNLVSNPVCKALEERGIEVDIASEQENTFKILEDHDYDVIALDVNGSNSDGFDLAHNIHEEKPDLPVILLAQTNSAIKTIGRIKKDIYDYFLKPFNMDYLSLRIREADVDHLLGNYIHQEFIGEQDKEPEATVPKIQPFEEHPSQYDTWFDKHKYVYESELRAAKKLMPRNGKGFEIGVGSGRFAAPLGIDFGIEPSRKMREIARTRGILAVDGVAEKLPLDNSLFDFALMVTTICFVDDAKSALKEAYRVLKQGGCLIIGLIDKDSLIGQTYQKHKKENVFYRVAEFFSVDQVVDLLEETGFTDFTFTQTIFRPLNEISELEPVKEGYGEGSFVVIRSVKRKAQANLY